jgi:uncharacterized protein
MERKPTVVHVTDVPSRPWRNGAGRTTLLHSHTSSVDRSEPAWTLSLASLDEPADFSTFEGYDRHFMVAGHNAVELDVGGHRRTVAYTEVASFPGEEQVRVDTRNGASSAVNLMVRRSDYHGVLTSCSLEDECVIDPRRVSALVLLSGELRVEGTILTTRGDTVLIGDRPLTIAGNSATVARILVTCPENGS